MMLGDGTHRRIVASTLAEIRGSLDLVKEGKIDEVNHVDYFHNERESAKNHNSVCTAYPSQPVPCPSSRL
jgi:hypothetical protein